MAGRAIALVISEQSFEPDGNISLKMPCAVAGDNDEMLGTIGLDVRFLPDATPVQIANAIEAEIDTRVAVEFPSLSIPNVRKVYLEVKRGT